MVSGGARPGSSELSGGARASEGGLYWCRSFRGEALFCRTKNDERFEHDIRVKSGNRIRLEIG